MNAKIAMQKQMQHLFTYYISENKVPKMKVCKMMRENMQTQEFL